jgi:putative membrane protein
MAVAAVYEIIEWQYAVKEGGEAGIAFLGSQGDIWDAQKDMLMDTLGGAIGVVLYFIVSRVKGDSSLKV